MTDEKDRETQQELFQEFSSAPKKPERFPSIAKTQKPILVSTTIEQVLMGAIVGILVLCAVFFLGVLRGKSLSGISSQPTAAASSPKSMAVPTTTLVRPVAVSTRSAPAAAPVKSPVSLVTPAATGKPYTIQLVTHRKKEYAENEMAAVRKIGFVSFIIPSGEYFQVCAGQYATKEEAKKDLALFAAKYKDCFLRRR